MAFSKKTHHQDPYQGAYPPTAGVPAARPQQQVALAKRRHQLKAGISHAVGFVVVIWAIFIINAFVFANNLNYFGIHPWDTSTLWHIITAPLLHGSWEHLIGNTSIGVVCAFLIGWSGKRVFWDVTIISTIVAGAFQWLFGGIGSTHIGAAGVIFGWLTYLVIRGIFNRSLSQILVGLALVFYYGGVFYGVLPSEPGISWQGHLGGAIGGFIAGACITSDDPPELKLRRAQRKQQQLRR